MMTRVRTFVPGLEERATIGTFHSFCAQILRQHGVHLGIRPNFAIYSQEADRQAILHDALKKQHLEDESTSPDEGKYLALIDKMKSRLIGPDKARDSLKTLPEADRIATVYRLYEEELRRANALDFNSLIFEAHQLATTFPAIAARYRRSHPFWLVDEFQDTNHAQYTLLRSLAGEEFKNVFAVADDDQIIYQWNGASFRNIQRFIADFSAQSLQLPTNYRCPPTIVEAANKLVAYNAQRTSDKARLIAGKTDHRFRDEEQISIRVFEDDVSETDGIAAIISGMGATTWGETAVLARTKALLEQMRAALQKVNVPSVISQRRDNFLSPELRWLNALLWQTLRPLDKRNMALIVESFNRLAGITLSADEVFAEAEALGEGYLASWFRSISMLPVAQTPKTLVGFAAPIVTSPGSFRGIIDGLMGEFEKRLAQNNSESDLAEDVSAWREIAREIAATVGRDLPLDQFLQELQLRSKEPTPKAATVRLMTIHAAKGREFDYVFLIGLAEEVLPSFQSLKKGEHSAEVEEERRNCFVAITRTKECLTLSRAEHYRGYPKGPSRFLREMGFAT